MKFIRTIAKTNLLVSLIGFWFLVAYRLLQGQPLNLPHSIHSPFPSWLGNVLGDGFFVYVFFFDKRISELLVRLFGVIGFIGVTVEVVMLAVGARGSSFDIFSWYVWPSVVLCALFGRRSLSEDELARLSSILSRRLGDNS